MPFSIGDKVMHPKFGAGEITGEEHRELVDGFTHYYVIKVISTGATAYVPVRKMDELGVRQVMSRAKLAQVLRTLRGVPLQLSGDFKERQARILEKIRTGRPVPIAEAVRDLTCRSSHKKLTQKDEQLLSRGRELLETEMMVANHLPVLDARETIDAALEEALEKVPSEPDYEKAAVPAS